MKLFLVRVFHSGNKSFEIDCDSEMDVHAMKHLIPVHLLNNFLNTQYKHKHHSVFLKCSIYVLFLHHLLIIVD